jgi:tetratricopeptide (TPR) repeat protein
VIDDQPEPGAYQFSHALIRETLYDEIPATRRSRLHLGIGAVLEELHRDDLEPVLSSLAHHYCAALPGGDAAKAVEYARRAAEHSDELFAYEEAARYYRLALQAIEVTGDPRRRLQLLIALGSAQIKAGENLEAAELLQEAAKSARSLGLAEEFARAACAFEEARWRPGLPGHAAVGLLREALVGLGEGDNPLKARVLSSLTRALIFSGDLEQAMAAHAQAVAMARRLGDTTALYTALVSVLSARWQPSGSKRAWRRRSKRCASPRRPETAKSPWTRGAGGCRPDGARRRPAARHRVRGYARLADEIGQPFFQYVSVLARNAGAVPRRFDESSATRGRRSIGKRMPSLDAVGVTVCRCSACAASRGGLPSSRRSSSTSSARRRPRRPGVPVSR